MLETFWFLIEHFCKVAGLADRRATTSKPWKKCTRNDARNERKDTRRGRTVHETARIGIEAARAKGRRTIERREGEMEGRQTRRPQPGGGGMGPRGEARGRESISLKSGYRAC